MSKMVELVARAIWDQRREWASRVCIELEEWGDGSISHANGIMEEARAAIEAMREPTCAMLEAAWPAAPREATSRKERWRARWRAMIDEASIYCKPGGCVEVSASETAKLVNLVARMKDALEVK